MTSIIVIIAVVIAAVQLWSAFEEWASTRANRISMEEELKEGE